MSHAPVRYGCWIKHTQHLSIMNDSDQSRDPNIYEEVMSDIDFW